VEPATFGTFVPQTCAEISAKVIAAITINGAASCGSVDISLGVNMSRAQVITRAAAEGCCAAQQSLICGPPPTGSPTAVPTRVPTSAPTLVRIGVRPGSSFYPAELPTTVVAGAVAQFASALSINGTVLAVALQQVLQGVLTPSRVLFSHQLVSHNGSGTASRFANTNPTTGNLVVFHGIADVGSTFNYQIRVEDASRAAPGNTGTIYDWQYTVVNDTPLVRTAEPFVLDLDGVSGCALGSISRPVPSPSRAKYAPVNSFRQGLPR
jgi:hypothetical protein